MNAKNAIDRKVSRVRGGDVRDTVREVSGREHGVEETLAAKGMGLDPIGEEAHGGIGRVRLNGFGGMPPEFAVRQRRLDIER